MGTIIDTPCARAGDLDLILATWDRPAHPVTDRLLRAPLEIEYVAGLPPRRESVCGQVWRLPFSRADLAIADAQRDSCRCRLVLAAAIPPQPHRPREIQPYLVGVRSAVADMRACRAAIFAIEQEHLQRFFRHRARIERQRLIIGIARAVLNLDALEI